MHNLLHSRLVYMWLGLKICNLAILNTCFVCNILQQRMIIMRSCIKISHRKSTKESLSEGRELCLRFSFSAPDSREQLTCLKCVFFTFVSDCLRGVL